jgi:Domain of unknown function (DUF4336)
MSLVCIVPDAVWHAQHPLKFGPIAITTRMTVLRLRDGSLWVHSPIPLTDALREQLEEVGNVRYVVAPNKSHHLFFRDFVSAFPAAQGFIAVGLELKRSDLAGFPPIPRDAPWQAEVEGFFIDGLPILNETVWFHRDTGTLVITDLLFCFSRSSRGLTSLVSKLLGVHGTLAMSRTMKLATRDKRALARSVQPLLSLPIKRVIVAHDQIVDEAATAKLTQAFAWLQ